MRWTIEEIRTFLDVMDTGTVSGAAARSNLSKSVVSKRIADLEAALGAALFQRHAGRISPTASAEELALRLRPALAEMNDAVESAAWGMAGLRGSLAIAAPMSFGTNHLSSVVADFARQHPDLDITLDYDDRVMDLVRGRFDVAVRIGQLRDSGLIARKLCEDPGSSRADQTSGAPENLMTFRPIRPSAISMSRRPASGSFGATMSSVRRPHESRVSANNGEAMRDMAIAGLGTRFAAVRRAGSIAERAVDQGRREAEADAAADFGRLAAGQADADEAAGDRRSSGKGLCRTATMAVVTIVGDRWRRVVSATERDVSGQIRASRLSASVRVA